MPVKRAIAFAFMIFGLPCLAGAQVSAACSEQNLTALLQSGNDAYLADDLGKADASWKAIAECPEGDASWPKAVFNLGQLKMKEGDFPSAIRYFDLVLQSHPNDKEPGGSLMETNRNYSHRSALQISECYEKLGNYRAALRYARLAKNRYRFYSWCGTCNRSAANAINLRIAYLTMQVAKFYALTFVVLGGVFLARRKFRQS